MSGRALLRGLRRWLLPLLAALTAAALVGSIVRGLQRTVWAAYTDGVSIRRPALESAVRLTLWDEPRAVPGELGADGDDPQPAFSADDTRVVFTRGLHTRTNADLFVAEWDGRAWTNLAPLAGVNTPAHELSPTLSADGRVLLFASDRAGGAGGYDLWSSAWDGTNWLAATNLGPAVNSAFDERGPALASDGSRLWFCSNRPHEGAAVADGGDAGGGGGYDLYAADAAGAPSPSSVTSAAPALVLSPARAVAALNTGADEVEPCPTPRGDRLYFASNRKGGRGGFDLYSAWLVDGRPQAVENAGGELNTGADDTSPAVRMQGFDLMFASGRGAGGAGEAGESLAAWSAAAREVVEGLDLTRWHLFKALLNRIKWWVLIVIAAAALLAYLLRHYRDLTSLFHKCLMLSVIVHVIILLLMAVWIISSELVGGMESKSMEITLSVDSLAQEKLALDMREEVTELPPSDVSLVVEQAQDPVPMPEFTPRTVQMDLPPIVTRTHEASLATFVTPSAPSQGAKDLPAIKELETVPVRERPPVEITLEEPVPEQQETSKVEVQDPKVEDLMAPVEVAFTPTPAPKAAPVRPMVEPGQIAAKTVEATASAVQVRDTGGKRVVASAGMEAKGQLPELKGVGDLSRLLVKHAGTGRRVRMNAPGQLDVPASHGQSISPQLLANPGKLATEVVEELGGSAATQGAIGRALDWFSRNQEPDGRWDIRRHGGKEGHDVAATSLALLCYYGWGAKHSEDGPYREVVRKAIAWLLAQMKEDGDLRQADRGGNMYDHGMAAIAIGEAYGMTKDPSLLDPARKVLAFVCAAQDKNGGGWRYKPDEGGDLSVFGWQYMALRSAELSGLDIPDEVLQKADGWLKRVSGGKDGGIYGYQAPATDRPAMIPTGMFCRQLARVRPDEPPMLESVDFMRVRSPFGEKREQRGNVDYYYLYYGTLALYQNQGPVWDTWNERMKEVLIDIQNKTGNEAGSWSPSGMWHGKEMGRAVTTAFATLSLEVYYRILPIYGFRSEPPAPAPIPQP